MEKYFGNWSSREDVGNDFYTRDYNYSTREYSSNIPDDFPTDEEFVFAIYGTPSYEGYAEVVFKRDGKLFQVSSSHCSCNGLEDSWDPSETSKEQLLKERWLINPENSYCDFDGADVEKIRAIVEVL